MREHNIVISSSKDTFVKFWDLDTEHNFKTLVGHRSEVNYKYKNNKYNIIMSVIIDILPQVWGFALVKNDLYLVTGCNDNELHVWQIFFIDATKTNIEAAIEDLNIEEDNEADGLVYKLKNIYFTSSVTKVFNE